MTGTLYDVWPCANDDGVQYSCGAKLNTGEPKPICVTNPQAFECAIDFERATGSGDTNIVNYLLDPINGVPTLKNGSHPSVISASQFAKWYKVFILFLL